MTLDAGRRCEDRQYVLMAAAYEPHGGLVPADTILCLMRRVHDQPLSRLSHWLVERTAVHFFWRSRTLMPLFQFVPGEMTLRPEVVRVVEELAPSFDDWDLAVWFAQPNICLNNRTPVDVLQTAPLAVLHAAQRHRYAAAA